MASAAPILHVIRSGLVESVHLGHVAVCTPNGTITAALGDPGRMLFARSSMKPLQAAVSLSCAGDDVSDEELAIMCASHNGEPVHVRAVRRVLRRAGLPSDALRCPPGWPLDMESAARVRSPRPELFNCSGKHAGMLLACVRRGWDLSTYPRSAHPLQRRVRSAVLDATGREVVRIGVDGCGVPVHGMPLSAMAMLFARLAAPERLGDLAGQVARCTSAMRAHPYLVAGRSRTDTAIMEVSPDLVVKTGAEGLACAAWLSEDLGIAVRVEDGGERASGPAMIRALSLIGALSPAEVRKLAPIAKRPVLGGGRRVGDMVAGFELRRR
ncbi:MAG: asparaginase, partial [Actinomycetota bacterium]|nr:asparaginase [Actinomycetota bacterium]